MQLTYQSTHENMRARMNSALGNAERRVPWANETTTATTQS